MKSDTKLVAVLVGLAVFVAMLQSSRSAEKPRHDANVLFMRQKLVWSQGVLEGIALEKFDLVAKNAIRMRDMTFSNMWLRMKTPEYIQQTASYYKKVDALYMAAVDKNLEAATEAYANVARNCVSCHRVVRVEQRKVLPAAEKVKP